MVNGAARAPIPDEIRTARDRVACSLLGESFNDRLRRDCIAEGVKLVSAHSGNLFDILKCDPRPSRKERETGLTPAYRFFSRWLHRSPECIVVYVCAYFLVLYC